jgi:hypothetical protein
MSTFDCSLVVALESIIIYVDILHVALFNKDLKTIETTKDLYFPTE